MRSEAAEREAHRVYCADGAARAQLLGNRGPVRFGSDGKLAPDIVEAYERNSFYVFENVVGAQELAEFRAEFHAVHENCPAQQGSSVDRHGRPTRYPPAEYSMQPPLSDPLGGGPIMTPHNFRTGENKQRHTMQMRAPEAPAGAPECVMDYIYSE